MKVMIGLETHVQLNTQSKAFCGCRNLVNLADEPEPNTLVCDTCLGLPGSKPRANRAMVEKALSVALSLGCRVPRQTYFSRKTYFYPDMSKNFQITQYEIPLAQGGTLKVGEKRVRIRRVHMEEDPSRIVHVGGLGGRTLLDYNRAGIPLIEIVTEPDLSSPEEARAFLQKLETILEYLGAYDPSSRAVFKSDANISLAGGKRVEVKNITGTKEIEQALKFEYLRQVNLLRRGGKVSQSTRTWDPVSGTTREMRTKETEEDYGYIFEGDLTVVELPASLPARIRKSLPELPDQKLHRFVKRFGLHPKVAEALVSELDLADLFEKVSGKVDPKLASVWLAGYLKKSLNYRDLRLRDSGLKTEWVLTLLKSIKDGEFTDRNAELLIRKMIEDKKDPETTRRKHNIGKMLKAVLPEEILIKDSVSGKKMTLNDILKDIINKNPKAVQDYRAGEEKALHYLVGIAMKETRGQVDASELRKLILRLI